MILEMPHAAGPPVWRKGNLRDENEASACRHRQINSLIVVIERQHELDLPGGLVTVGAPVRKAVQVELVIDPVQSMDVICTSPGLLEYSRATLDPPLKPQLVAHRVNLEICRHCPFWEAENIEAP